MPSYCSLLRIRGKQAEAEELLREALTARQKRHGPAHPWAADILIIQARVLGGPGDVARRAQLFREGLTIYSQSTIPPRRALGMCLDRLAPHLSGDQLYETARTLARSAQARDEQDPGRPKYMDLAMSALRHAGRRGFKDVERLRSDADFAVLRGREDFQQLLGELGAVR